MKKLPIILAAVMLLSSCGAAPLPPVDYSETGTAQAEVTSPESTDEAPASSADGTAPEITEPDNPEGLTPIYDLSAINAAYASGDRSGLSKKDSDILEAAERAVSEFYREGMSERETVFAAHDWLVENVTYDEKMLLAIPKQTPDSENPYGALCLGQAICMGYTTSFQLFMDMLGIKCSIVRGEGFGEDVWEEHAWNLVEVGGNYYHVDVTWDDFVPDEAGRIPFHIYTMVDDTAMEELHSWDHEKYPAATVFDPSYYTENGFYAETAEEVREIQRRASESGLKWCEVMTPGDLTAFSSCVEYYWPSSVGDYSVTVYWLR